ncbi:hypothetical protein SAMN02745883_02041 [Caminicella sporogenes DSM 14501]|uniref:DUF5673 domain-containing protein n=1 Tax=Caminicella sporogenes DSM 14501 TaxID=1121266 RepID=A0A1M6SFK1_9FIRM|nr:hypothetical protein [Caminicella sporogenes]RKD26642.1 hypothetical protein BET04_10160 [Caminicella sporogenes]SHK43459.1 hypothetical protein SAMN02745883_02041 [Caminicella sporogenes DSM 14501]
MIIKFQIIGVILIIMIIIVREFKKYKRRDSIIVKSIKRINHVYFFISLAFFVFVFFYFEIFLAYFLKAHRLLVPKYLNKWYEILFRYEYLEVIKNNFKQKEMIKEYCIINWYLQMGLVYFFSGITYGLVAVDYMLRLFEGNILYKDKIYTYNGSYDLNRLIDYSWNLNEKKTKKENIKYYDLKLKIANKKLNKWFTGEDTKTVYIEINCDDKEKVENFLKGLNIKKAY